MTEVDKDFYKSPMEMLKSQVSKDLGRVPSREELQEFGYQVGLSHWVERRDVAPGIAFRAHYEWNDGVWSHLSRKWIKYLLDRVGLDTFTLQEAYAIRDKYDGKGGRQSMGNPTGVSLFGCIHRGLMERPERAKYRFLTEELP